MACSRDVAVLALVRPDRPAGGGIEVAGRGPEERAGNGPALRSRRAASGEVNRR